MRIVHVITSLKAGGTEAQLYALLTHFKRDTTNEHHVIYFRAGPMVEKIKELGFPLYHVQGVLSGYDPEPLLYYRLKKLIKELQPDLIHSALWTADVMSRLVGKALDIPVISDIHVDCGQRWWFRNWLDARTVHLAARLVAVSNVTKISFQNSVLKRVRLEKNRERITKDLLLIYDSIDIDNVLYNGLGNPIKREEIGLQEHDFVFGYVCRLNHNKGCSVLINAFAQLCERLTVRESQKNDVITKNSPKLCLIGEGPLLKELQALTVSLGVADKVLFMGYRADAHRFYPLFDCYVMASHFEAISIALLDAMCFNLPIITTQRWSFHDIVEHGKNGLTVPAGDADAMGYAMEEIYARQDKALQMGEINRKIVGEKFSLQTKVEQYIDLFKQVIQEHTKIR